MMLPRVPVLLALCLPGWVQGSSTLSWKPSPASFYIHRVISELLREILKLPAATRKGVPHQNHSAI